MIKNLSIFLTQTKVIDPGLKKDLIDIQNQSKIFFVKDIIDVHKINFDIVIVSTTANNRGKILNSILNQLKFEFIIIEKPICNSLNDLELLKNIANKKIFVNFPHRYCDWSLKVKKRIQDYFCNKKLKIIVTGRELNIACNVSHFVDLVNMWTGSLPISVNNSNLKNWVASKREGFFELEGGIDISFSKWS